MGFVWVWPSIKPYDLLALGALTMSGESRKALRMGLTFDNMGFKFVGRTFVSDASSQLRRCHLRCRSARSGSMVPFGTMPP